MKNREVKFRVWDFTKNKWLFGNGGYKDYINIHHYTNGDFRLHGISEECYSIQQFTGLKDKNGKEIYEGDILADESTFNSVKNKFSRLKYHSQCEVIFDIKEARFGLRCRVDGQIYGFDTLNLERGIITGNIFENPELLKKDS